MDMERCVYGRGMEGVEKRPCGVSQACMRVPGGALLSRSPTGEGWIPLPPANHLLTQIPQWGFPSAGTRSAFPLLI